MDLPEEKERESPPSEHINNPEGPSVQQLFGLSRLNFNGSPLLGPWVGQYNANTRQPSLEDISLRLRISKEQEQRQQLFHLFNFHQQQLQLQQRQQLHLQQQQQQLQPQNLKVNLKSSPIKANKAVHAKAPSQPRRTVADPYEHQRQNANFTSPKVKTVMDLPNSSDVLKIGLPESSRSHLFRHASEITRETKGGYLQGRLYIPETNRPAYMRLSLVPADVAVDMNPFHLHPNLLHINMRTNKKKRNIQVGELPDDVDWCFIFKIEHGDVLRICPPQNPKCKKPRFHLNPHNEAVSDTPESLNLEDAFRRSAKASLQRSILNTTSGGSDPLNLGRLILPREHITTRVASVKDNYIEMGNTGLMLNIITPLQKFSKGGTNLSEDRIKLQQVRLLIELFSVDDFQFITSAFSEVITNSKSKECGPLQLHDVNPAISCCECETKVFMLSFFKLVSGARANFILYDPIRHTVCYDGYDNLFKRIEQPPAKDCQVFNQCVVTCKVPKQDQGVIEAIKKAGLQLRLTAFRPSDRKMSNTSFEFKYLKHGHYEEGEEPILDTCKGVCKHFDQHKEVSKELPIAKPGVIRRHPTNQLVPEEVLNKSNESRGDDEEEDPNGSPINDSYPSMCSIPTILQQHTTQEMIERGGIFKPQLPKKRPYLPPNLHADTPSLVHVNGIMDMKVNQEDIMMASTSKKMKMMSASPESPITIKEENDADDEDYDAPTRASAAEDPPKFSPMRFSEATLLALPREERVESALPSLAKTVLLEQRRNGCENRLVPRSLAKKSIDDNKQ
ncbi:hypothetical protein TCAL_09939 [Tigriopus californicus]|uniref:Uncharacterized protein n=1 Tax=Tigriopus californicus TaxID=6832 RepID=A0A553PST4_TIGCA|nr:hypothetical protein TCAL_09939 [Tigriopus californicus]